MTRLVVGPFNRVEGDLEVTLDLAEGRVAAAYVNSPLYRGFEQILQGKAPEDALVLVPRICGICSVAQSAAAAAALAQAMGIQPTENGQRVANLVLAAENLADHLSHFYLFFMPDFARAAYAGRPWFAEVQARFQAMAGSAHGDVLPARAGLLKLMGILAGKWPHTLALQPGGTSRAVQRGDLPQLFILLRECRTWLETRLFGDSLETVAALDSPAALAAWRGARPTQGKGPGDLRLFLDIADDLQLAQQGRATDLFLSYGAYAQQEGDEERTLFPAGVWHGAEGRLENLEPGSIIEDVSHAWLAGDEALHPARGATLPQADKDGAYTWCKAPRLAGRVVETGALARQVVAGQPLIRELVAASGGNVRNRVLARALELARVLPAMEAWINGFVPGAAYCHHGRSPVEGEGSGRVEAARGALGHWLQIRRGRIHNYQIIAPTTWNFSPRDSQGTPGALEQALVGTPVGPDEKTPLAVQHVVRSFDPCMVCTVH